MAAGGRSLVAVRCAFAAALVLLLAGEASARCLYLGANSLVDNYVVLDLTDLSRVASFDAIGQPDAMVVRDHRLYVNIVGFIGDDGYHLPGRIAEVNLEERRLARQFPTGRANIDLAWANGKLYTANFSDQTVTVADPATGSTTTLHGFGRFPSALAASPDGARVYVADVEVFVIDTASDRVIETFDSSRAAEDVLVTDDLFLISGSGPGTSGGLRAFRRDVAGHPPAWETPLGFSRSFTATSTRLVSVSRRSIQIVSLTEPPHERVSHRLGSGTADLWTAFADGETVYVAGDEGVFRFEAGSAQHPALIYPKRVREVVVAPCPGTQSTFAGDADCDALLAAADAAATGAAVFDRVARLRCDADCNGDGRVTAADLPCATRALAVS